MFGLFSKKEKLSTPSKQQNTSSQFPEHITQLLDVITKGLRDNQGRVQIETIFATLGALAGFATQMGLRKRFIESGAMPISQVFMRLDCKNGETFYVGNSLLEGLCRMEEGKLSVLSMTASAAQSIGAQHFPNMQSLVERVSSSHGTELFGIPRLPDNHAPLHKPVDLLRDSWDGVANWLTLHDKGEALNWPFLIGQAIQVLIYKTNGTGNPNIITHIVMECALPMAQINPDLIVGKLGTVQPISIDLQRTEAGKLLTSAAFKNAVDAAKVDSVKPA